MTPYTARAADDFDTIRQRMTALRLQRDGKCAIREGKPIELTEAELAHASGGNADDGPWCGTHAPGWHPPVLGSHAA